MTTIETSNSELIVRVEGMDRIFAFKSELRIPLTHVAGAERAADEARTFWHGIRFPGTHIPGLITAGTYYESGRRAFWDVHDPERALAIHLRDEKYDKLVIEVEDVNAALAQIASACRMAGAGGPPPAA
jgi:hypothetical protein